MALDITKRLVIKPETFIGESVAVLGIKGSGKSNTAAVLMEEFLDLGIPIIVVDYEGEYSGLKSDYPQVAVVGKSTECTVDIEMNADNATEIAAKVYENGLSVIIDLTDEEESNHSQIIGQFFTQVWLSAKAKKIPSVIFLEECHNWIPQASKSAVSGLFVKLALRGRKRGLSLIMMSQRSAMVSKHVLSQADICFLHKVRHPADLDVYYGLIPRKRGWIAEKVGRMKKGEVLLLKGESCTSWQMRVRTTKHLGKTPGLDRIPNRSRQMSLIDMMASKYD